MIVRAPGKLVLVGEYAVLDGGAALVCAVDRGVECQFSPDASRTTTAPTDTRFVDAALDAVNAPAGHYAFSAWNPVDLPEKPGLGGSAAATVSAVLAGMTAAGPGRSVSSRTLYALAANVHRAVQGGGSGIDIAASAYGGVLRIEGDLRTSTEAPTPVVVWSGASARTGPRVERYRAWTDRHGFVRDSTAVTDLFKTDPVGAIRASERMLRHMTAAAQIAWATPTLDWIIQTAAAHGGAAKPSGAGGGDVAVALFDDLDAENAFRQRCKERGLPPIGVQISGPAHVLDGSRPATEYP